MGARSELSHAAPASTAVQVALGAALLPFDALRVLAGHAAPVVGPAVRVALRPARIPAPLQPGHWLDVVARRGAAQRTSLALEVARLLDSIVPAALDEVLRRTDLTALVLRHVDLDEVVGAVDLDAAAQRLDLDAAAQRLDLDAAAQRLDLDAVAGRLDIDALLDRLDLTELVLRRVDLDVLVREVLDRVDVARITALATEVIDAVDLPDIIRESTGSMASETVMSARMQGIAADETVARIRDRLLLRRSHPAANQEQPAARRVDERSV